MNRNNLDNFCHVKGCFLEERDVRVYLIPINYLFNIQKLSIYIVFFFRNFYDAFCVCCSHMSSFHLVYTKRNKEIARSCNCRGDAVNFLRCLSLIDSRTSDAIVIHERSIRFQLQSTGLITSAPVNGGNKRRETEKANTLQ